MQHDTTKWNLYDNDKFQVASLVSFEKMAPGYVKHTSPDGTGLQLTFKFKTDQTDGLIFYTTTRNQDSYVSLSLAESALILRAAPGGELSTGTAFIMFVFYWCYKLYSLEQRNISGIHIS